MIETTERSCLLQKLASSLIKNATAANEIEQNIFVAVDLINRIEDRQLISPDEQVLFATMNDTAGKKALSIPDFVRQDISV